MAVSKRWQRCAVSVAVLAIGLGVVWLTIALSSWWTLATAFVRRPYRRTAEFWHVWLPVSAAILQAGLSGPLAASVIGPDMRRVRWLCDAYGIGMAAFLACLFVPDGTALSIVSVAVLAVTAFVVARRRSSSVPWLAPVWGAAAILGMTIGVSTDEPVASAGWILFMIAVAFLARHARRQIEHIGSVISPEASMRERPV